MSYPGERTTYPAKGCRILEKEQPIQQKDDVFWRKNNLSREWLTYSGERTNYPAIGCRILEKEQTIQRKAVVF